MVWDGSYVRFVGSELSSLHGNGAEGLLFHGIQLVVRLILGGDEGFLVSLIVVFASGVRGWRRMVSNLPRKVQLLHMNALIVVRSFLQREPGPFALYCASSHVSASIAHLTYVFPSGLFQAPQGV